MAGIKLLKEHGVGSTQQHDRVQHNLHHENPAAEDSPKQKSVDHGEFIKIRALTWIVGEIDQSLYREHAYASAQLLKNHYPTFEQRNQASFRESHFHTIH
jgi:hypothetical protein